MFYINNQLWKIAFVDSWSIYLKNEDTGSFSLGSCDILSHTIYVNKYLVDEKLFKVICHEITHAVLYSYNINLEYFNEEELVDIISSYGYEILYLTTQVFQNLNEAY